MFIHLHYKEKYLVDQLQGVELIQHLHLFLCWKKEHSNCSNERKSFLEIPWYTDEIKKASVSTDRFDIKRKGIREMI